MDTHFLIFVNFTARKPSSIIALLITSPIQKKEKQRKEGESTFKSPSLKGNDIYNINWIYFQQPDL